MELIKPLLGTNEPYTHAEPAARIVDLARPMSWAPALKSEHHGWLCFEVTANSIYATKPLPYYKQKLSLTLKELPSSPLCMPEP